MSIASRIAFAALLCLIAVASQGCRHEERLNAGGSTFIYPMMSKWTSEYYKHRHIQVNYQSVGSGAGIRQMSAGLFDFGCSDSPMNDEQLKRAQEQGGEVIHIPLVMGGVVPSYNLPEIKEKIRFTGPVLAEIFLGRITQWNDPALQAINPGVRLPDKSIAVVHRSDGSGTTYLWADYLSRVSAAWKKEIGAGTSLNWPVGIGQKGNEGVAGQIARNEGSLGYIELVYAMQNQMQFGMVQNREGVFVEANLESVTAAADAGIASIPEDFRYSIANGPGQGTYPISGTSWAIFYANQPTEKRHLILDFIRFITQDGQHFAKDFHYAPLPATLAQRIARKLEKWEKAS